MNLRRCYLTKNNCYKKATPIKVTGIVVHSTGANNPSLGRYVPNYDGKLTPNKYNNHWDQPKPGGKSICVHAFIGYDKDKKVCTYETLPYNIAAWGVGSGKKGSYNYNPQAKIQFEICEDSLKNKDYFEDVMIEARDYCVYLCKKFKLTEKDIVDHSEASKKGYASNHGDISHWLKIYGKDMNWFRGTVKAILDDDKPIDTHIYYVVKKGDNLSTIAKKYKTNWLVLYIRNKKLIDSEAKKRGIKKKYYNYIFAGERLVIK